MLLQAAACRRMVGDLREAAEVYQHGMPTISMLHFVSIPYVLPFVVIEAEPTHNEAKMKLAEIFEILNEPRKALDLVLQGWTIVKQKRHGINN